RYLGNDDSIKYYAQELKENAYNLTRMNLVMKGVKPDNILIRNGDTLEDDWPYFDEADPDNTYEPLYVNAVVSNPPYSLEWDPTDKEEDARFSDFGVAPKKKADYAFLLHDLYHLQPDGIVTIVLPHGVLFRSGEEGEIRKNLIEGNYIDTVIGLPSNIFYATGIPTIIMVLKKQKKTSDVLFVDASRGFEKYGKKNRLRASDIKRIADTVIHRKDIDKYSKKVTRNEIRQNDYNLNIPRYVDSAEPAEPWDIYATMFGGIPMTELDHLEAFWKAFPSLKGDIFTDLAVPYTSLATKDLKQTVFHNKDVMQFEEDFKNRFGNFDSLLHERLIDRYDQVLLAQEESDLAKEIFDRISEIPVVDPYEAYQKLDNQWSQISGDLEILQTEGFDASKKVEPSLKLEVQLAGKPSVIFYLDSAW
ncbi:MAG: N-6 DNA methylase, partial [Bacteroidales bacterium]|nr:N-6 DNA methylase [Bacteroidales bacterium]